MKFPPFGRELAERLRWKNPPDFVIVTAGLGAWDRARDWLDNNRDISVLVLKPDTNPKDFRWPVKGQTVAVEVAVGPSDETLQELAEELLEHSALFVTVVSTDLTNHFMEFTK